MSLNSCEFKVGRLMEIRVGSGYRCPADVDEMIRMMTSKAESLPAGQKYVIAADWRGVTVMSPETSTRARAMLARVNAQVLRSSILTLPDQSMTNLQVQRLIRESENQDRRHFTSAQEQQTWLGEILTVEESARLRQFLTAAASG